MLEWLKELLMIYTWKELWVIVSVPTLIVGVWALFCFLLTIPSDIIRIIGIWTLIFALTAGAAAVDVLKRQKSKA